MTKSVFTDAYAMMRETLVVARRGAGVTQVELARRLGWTQSTVSQFERGVRRLDVIEFCAVALAIGVHPVQLFGAVVEKLPDKLSV